MVFDSLVLLELKDKKSGKSSITVNGAERRSRLLRPLDHPGHGRGRSRRGRRREERSGEGSQAVVISNQRSPFFLSQIQSELPTHDGFTTRTARENEAAAAPAAIKGNQGINHGINQPTGRRGRIKISGCGWKPAASGGGQLSGEEPKRIRIMYPARSRAPDDRGRSSGFKSDDRDNDSTSIHQAV
ncbi:PREDICTED: uncharacterized protein LOC105449102 [Wasmannia auropunctata]|uniref:uncharacterized protein LOC105449102 n=1 Tax=Wasmannia auropunctata TaxID=64793 RepID=UPI0005F0C02F|nr:PREDICTED: uncharacterized protein LOC105449102 [Wasmannia auropunctata]